MNWLRSRIKQLLIMIPCGLVLTYMFVLGLVVGERKELDKYDMYARLLGGLIGQIIQILIVLLI